MLSHIALLLLSFVALSSSEPAISKDVIKTPDAPQPIGPYNQGIRAGNYLYVSGQLGLDPKTGEFASKEITGQVHQSIRNFRAVVLAGGSNMDLVLKTLVFLNNMTDFNTMNAIYAQYFPNNPPARSTIQAPLPRGGLFEIEGVSLVP